MVIKRQKLAEKTSFRSCQKLLCLFCFFRKHVHLHAYVKRVCVLIKKKSLAYSHLRLSHRTEAFFQLINFLITVFCVRWKTFFFSFFSLFPVFVFLTLSCFCISKKFLQLEKTLKVIIWLLMRKLRGKKGEDSFCRDFWCSWKKI